MTSDCRAKSNRGKGKIAEEIFFAQIKVSGGKGNTFATVIPIGMLRY